MIKKTLVFTIGPLVLFLSWELLSRTGGIDPSFFPAPSHIFSRLWQLVVGSSQFQEHFLKSMQRLLIAALISVPLAVLLAPFLILNHWVGNFFRPLVALFYPIPKLAVFPLLLLIFGIGDASKIAVVAVGIFFLVLMSAMQGVSRLQSGGYYNIARIYQVPKWRQIFDISIRGSLPEILNGLRMGLGHALALIVASEFTIADRGIGVFIWNAWDQFQILDVYVGIFMLSMISWLLFAILDEIQKRTKS